MLRRAIIGPRWLALALLLVLPGVAGAQITFTPSKADTTQTFVAAPVLWDDFVGGAPATANAFGQLNWGWSTATGSQVSPTVANHPGVVRGTVGATAAGYLLLGNGPTSTFGSIDSALWIVRFAGGANVPDSYVALAWSTTVGTMRGCWFKHAAADTNWFAVCKNGTGTSTTDTGVAFAADTWVTLEIWPCQGNTAQFRINGALVATISGANYPDATMDTWPWILHNTNGTASTFDIDYFALRYNVSR